MLVELWVVLVGQPGVLGISEDQREVPPLQDQDPGNWLARPSRGGDGSATSVESTGGSNGIPEVASAVRSGGLQWDTRRVHWGVNVGSKGWEHQRGTCCYPK